MEGEDRGPDKWNPSKKNSDNAIQQLLLKVDKSKTVKIWMHYLKRFPYMFEMREDKRGPKGKNVAWGRRKPMQRKKLDTLDHHEHELDCHHVKDAQLVLRIEKDGVCRLWKPLFFFFF